jgi:hypothetical protein
MKEGDLHMHAARITLVDADHIKSVWSMTKDGKPMGEARFDLTKKGGSGAAARPSQPIRSVRPT